MIWENGIEIRIISYMERVARPGSMHDTGCLGLVHWDDPEGWYGEGGGRRVQDGEHMYTCGGFIDIWQNQYNSVKFKNKIKKKKKRSGCQQLTSMVMSYYLVSTFSPQPELSTGFTSVTLYIWAERRETQIK